MQAVRMLTGFVIVLGTAAASLPAREWSDSTGVFKLEAELVGVTGDTVRLKKIDGAVVEVPLDRLSAADRRFLQSQTSQPGRRGVQIRHKSIADAIETALKRPATAEFIDTPLQNAVDYFTNFADVPVKLDLRALDDVGIGSDVPITVNVRGVDLATVLDNILEPLDLTWIVWNEVLLITTPEEAESGLEPRVYRLRKPVRFDGLIRDITTNIQPESWDSVGGPGSIEVLPVDLLIIAQTDRVNREIIQHYGDLLEIVRPAERFPVPGPSTKRVKAALFQPVQMDFIETPLRDVIAFLKDQHKIDLRIDTKALEDIGIGTDIPITMDLKGVQLRSGLAFLLKPLDLVWVADKQGVLITTLEDAERRMQLVSYRVNDFVPRQQFDALIRIITSTVKPQSWDSVGGPGGIRFGVRGTLDVRQTFNTHMVLARLLEDMRRGRGVR